MMFCDHIQTNVALVSPLLRLENNHCHIEESECVLKRAHKYSELIILYEKKGLHQKGETWGVLLVNCITVIFPLFIMFCLFNSSLLAK